MTGLLVLLSVIQHSLTSFAEISTLGVPDPLRAIKCCLMVDKKMMGVELILMELFQDLSPCEKDLLDLKLNQ